jgi:hypothetical protein
MKTNTTAVVLTLLVSILLWERIAPALADADRRYDMTALVRAVEANAKATQDLASATREAARNCR